MSTILRRNADIRDYKTRLESMLNEVNENINNPDYNLESLNNRFEEFANIMRPSLAELVKTELLSELEKQVDYAKDNEEFEEMDSYSFGQKIFQDHVEDLSLYQGYYTYTVDNENALKGIEYNGGELYESVSESVEDYFNDINKMPNETEKFAAYMEYGITDVFVDYAKYVDMSEYAENYDIDFDNITLADVMAIHNAISDELNIERKYSKEDILKELDNDMNEDKDLDM